MKKIFNLEGLEYENILPATESDRTEIEKYLTREIELSYDDQLRVWSEGGIYVADLVKSREINIGARIREMRELSNLTQKQLAEMIGTTQSQIAKYERNEQDMTVLRLLEIAKALNIPASDFLKEV